MEKITNDPENYRKMSEPFENSGEANEKLERFFDAIEDLRKKHHMKDVEVIVKVSVMEDDVETSKMAQAHFGNLFERLPMCAWAYGKARAEYDGIISKMAS